MKKQVLGIQYRGIECSSITFYTRKYSSQWARLIRSLDILIKL